MANTTIPSELIQASVALGGSPTTTTQSASDNTTKIATTAYVTAAVNSLIDSAPGTMNTLNEIAAALNDDASFNTTVTNAIATKLPLGGGTMTGNIAHASNFTIDAGGDIILDADSGVWRFKDADATLFQIAKDGQSLVLYTGTSDGDMVFKGNDGGSTITALTLDMSNAGAAIFNNTIASGAITCDGVLAGNVNIASNQITSGYDQNSDNLDVWINYRGYQGGTNYFRDFRVGNGKQAQLLFVDGSSGTVAVNNALTVGGTITVTGAINGFGLKAFGTESLLISQDGGTGTINAANYNTGFGHNVFNALTSGDENTAFGGAALKANSTASYNTGLGYGSLSATVDGDRNTAVGWNSMSTNVDGDRSVAVGFAALQSQEPASKTDMYNTAMGYNAGQGITTGINNTFMGGLCGDGTDDGNRNVAVGRSALSGNCADNNVAIGYDTQPISTASNNVSVGYQALKANTSGHSNVAVGHNALLTSATRMGNVAVGFNAAQDIDTTGVVAIGYQALMNSGSGYDTVAIGTNAMYSNNTGNSNVAIGFGAMYDNDSGHFNVAVGNNALNNVISGIQNTAIGSGAGDDITTGVGNICIGHGATTVTSNRNYSITMGRNVASVGDYYFTFGVDTSDHRVYNNFTSNASWTRASDERIKKDISTNTDCGLNFINDLRTVTYKFKAPSELDSSMAGYDASKTEAIHKEKMYGFVAQEVKAAMDTHNITDFAGHHQIEDGADNLQGISYEMFVMPLVKAIQEQQTLIESLTARIETLEG